MLAPSGSRVSYGQSEVLHGLDFTVAPGEIIAVLGRNGMGKTTVMKSLIGLIPVKAGEIHLTDAKLTALGRAMSAWRRASPTSRRGE
jgi:urea transport system ATP-binding protein